MGDFVDGMKRIECLLEETLLAEDLLWQQLIPVSVHCDDNMYCRAPNVLHRVMQPNQQYFDRLEHRWVCCQAR